MQLAEVDEPVVARILDRGVRERTERDRRMGGEVMRRVRRECDCGFELLLLDGESLSVGVSEVGFVEGGLRGIMPDWEKQVHLQNEGTAVVVSFE